ncbi:MAG: hypothetical protein VYD78_00830 [Gemmatimonadota bacterium]|nr:hypothetical protein [Gemmatimonadota bacterium]
MKTRTPILLLALLLTSCSLVFSEGPPPGWDTPAGPTQEEKEVEEVTPGMIRGAGTLSEVEFTEDQAEEMADEVNRNLRRAITLDPCNPSSPWGIVDVGMAIAAAGSGYIASSGNLGPTEDRGEHILAGALVGLGYAIAASVGFKKSDNCKDFQGRFPEYFTQPLPNIRIIDDSPRMGGANLITAAELQQADVLDRSAYEAIQTLRPQWLRRTGFAEGGFPSLFLDNQPYELEVKELDRLREALESIRPDQVAEMRFVSPTDASIRYGTGYPSGVIEVITRNR